MSKDDYIKLHMAGQPLSPITVVASKAGRTVKLTSTTRTIVAQELSNKKVIHEVKAQAKDVVAVEKWVRNGSAIKG